jgi:hypothetical protein
MAGCLSPAQNIPAAEALQWLAMGGGGTVVGSIQAVRRRLSLTRPEVLVARCTRVGRSRSRHAAEISASFSFSAGESSTTDGVRRGGRLLELTERDVGRDAEREGLLEAITVPASRARVQPATSTSYSRVKQGDGRGKVKRWCVSAIT